MEDFNLFLDDIKPKPILTNLPPYELGQVACPVLPNGVTLKWWENGDVSATGSVTDDFIFELKTAIYTAAGLPVPPTEIAQHEEIKQAPLTARQYFAASPAAVAFIRKTPAEQEAQIRSMTATQKDTLLVYLSVAVAALVKERFL